MMFVCLWGRTQRDEVAAERTEVQWDAQSGAPVVGRKRVIFLGRGLEGYSVVATCRQ
jgi:hypothetical protein